jgi:hypothetical protein
VDEHRLARPHAGDLVQEGVGGRGDRGERGRGLQGDAVGHRDDHRGRRHGDLGVPADDGHRGYPLADGEPGDAGAERGHVPRHLEAGDERQRGRLVVAAAGHDLGVVDARVATAMATSPGPGAGSGASRSSRTSGPPAAVT